MRSMKKPYLGPATTIILRLARVAADRGSALDHVFQHFDRAVMP
jgi:hypothetical protein